MTIRLIVDNKNKNLDYALKYASIGWHVLPIFPIRNGICSCSHGDQCKTPGKHPITQLVPIGQNQATTDPDIIKSWFGRWPDANIGIFLSKSKLCAIDVDPRNGGLYTFENLEQEHGQITSDVVQFTGGQGYHYLYSLPESIHNLPGKLGSGVDLKLNGYVNVEPSNHISGGHYEWEGSSSPLEGSMPSPLPDWIRGLSYKSDAPSDHVGERYVTEAQAEELRAALQFIDADERDTWIRVGTALKTIGASGWHLWLEYSQRSSKFNLRDQQRTWASLNPRSINIESVFFLAQQNGWVNTVSISASISTLPSTPAISLQPSTPDEEVKENKAKPPIEYKFPEHLLNVPGLVGDIAEYLNASANYPQPILELAASLAFCGALFGRKVRTKSNIRSNIYAIGIAHSGSGKDNARQALKRLAVMAGRRELIGTEKIQSEQGLFDMLHQTPSTVWLADEFGRILRSMSDSRAPGYAKAIATSLIELTGSSQSFYMEPRKAGIGTDGREPRIIKSPNLCLYGTTVPGRLFQSMTPEEITDGFLPRFLLFETDNNDPDLRGPIPYNTDGIIELIQRWNEVSINPYSDGNLAEAGDPNPLIVPSTIDADAIFDSYQKKWRERKVTNFGTGLDAVYARALENAYRLALIRSAGLSIDRPVIDAQTAQWACELVDFLIKHACNQAKDNIAQNPHDALSKKILAFIRQKGECTRNDITMKFRHEQKRDRDNAIIDLIDAGNISHIIIRSEVRGAPPKTIYHFEK